MPGGSLVGLPEGIYSRTDPEVTYPEYQCPEARWWAYPEALLDVLTQKSRTVGINAMRLCDLPCGSLRNC